MPRLLSAFISFFTSERALSNRALSAQGIALHMALPLLVGALTLAPGLLLIHWLHAETSLYAWLLVSGTALSAGIASVVLLAQRLREVSLRSHDDLAQSLRRRVVNRQFDQPLPVAAGDATPELVAEINRLLHWLGQQHQELADEKAALALWGREQDQALQQEAAARKSAQEKLQKLARELDNLNRELADALRLSQSADKAKAEFLANMSHEIRTPLNAVIGVASLLDRSTLNERQRQQVGMIFESGKSLLRTLNDIMDYVRIEAGEIELDAFPFNLADTLNAVFQRHRELAYARGLDYSLRYGDPLPKLFMGDGARIQQLVHSLIDNAIKFTHDGSVQVHISGYALHSSRYLMRIAVQDTGIGISPEQRDDLFKVFTQGDSSITRAYGGSGMGLAICSRLVKLMEGTLGVDSEPGQGSLFWVELPLRLYRDITVAIPETA
ncbi:MAG TPA: ATP-binding protein [Dongiaceae bacterium]|nr:ATP-binding protein [Dongiaceae bacterium]